MPYPQEKIKKSSVIAWLLFTIITALILWSIIFLPPKNTLKNSKQWGGYSPIAVYQIYDKDTGVYYAITETGGICPMYTIEGEVKLVDQGNEYVIHKNLGEPNAQE